METETREDRLDAMEQHGFNERHVYENYVEGVLGWYNTSNYTDEEIADEADEAYRGEYVSMIDFITEEFSNEICLAIDDLVTINGLKIGWYVSENDIYHGLARDFEYEGWICVNGSVFAPI